MDATPPAADLLDRATTRARFPALIANPQTVHTCAPGGTQVLDVALQAMREAAVEVNANAGGPFAASLAVTELVDLARSTLGTFLDCEPEGIVLGPNMTTLAMHLSHALDEALATGGEVVCCRMDHDANVAPWLGLAERTGATVRWIDITHDGRIDSDSIAHAITDRTRVVTFPLASNALGTIVDPAPIVAAARAVGALVIVDAVHAAPHVPAHRRAIGADVLFASPYKFFGPHSGVMAADPALLARLTPDRVRPQPDSGPGRWQTGTGSYEAAAAVTAAVDYLLEVGMDRVVAHERQLSRRMLDGLDQRPSWTLHGLRDPAERTPTFALTHASLSPHQVAAGLAAEDVNAYPGHWYAVEPMSRLGLLDRGGATRLGFAHYHGVEDVDRVLAALDAVAATASDRGAAR